jgi:ABC-type antimicrobial peptide transport system permease subunit
MGIKTNFPINDLRRRKFQTTITITTLTLSVASTLFLLLFSSNLGLGGTSDTLTLGLTSIFTQFVIFIGFLIFAIGAVLTSFVAFFTMAQRTRDFGLIKAAGCPNSLVAGYLTTELLATTSIGCILGLVLGFLMDFGISTVVFSSYKMPNFWFAPLVFAAFFVFAIFFGLQPILKAAKMSPVQALSPVSYYNLTATNQHKALSHSALTWRIATRSLFRRQSATIRIVLLLSIVFILLTVTVAGGIIASVTTTTWVQEPVNNDAIVVAHNSMGNQYTLLLSKFSGAKETSDFNYSDPKFSIPLTAIDQLTALPTVKLVDSRLILNESVKEIGNFTVNPDNEQTFSVGDSRQGVSLVEGVNPSDLASSWFVQGRFLSAGDVDAAVISDSVAQTMYNPDPSKGISMANPLVEGIEFQNNTFSIVGTCVDPINNGYVTYVPIERLMNLTGLSNPNLLLLELNNASDRTSDIAQIKTVVQAVDPDLNVFTLNDVVAKNTNFLASTWQTIMLLPVFTLASATLCLVGYMMLAVDEQHQEFAVLRAVGAKPKVVVAILAIQSIFVLISSFAAGIPLGIIITLIFLTSQPVVTTLATIEIVGLLLVALTAMFLFSLYPALRLAKTSILKIMT